MLHGLQLLEAATIEQLVAVTFRAIGDGTEAVLDMHEVLAELFHPEHPPLTEFEIVKSLVAAQVIVDSDGPATTASVLQRLRSTHPEMFADLPAAPAGAVALALALRLSRAEQTPTTEFVSTNMQMARLVAMPAVPPTWRVFVQEVVPGPVVVHEGDGSEGRLHLLFCAELGDIEAFAGALRDYGPLNSYDVTLPDSAATAGGEWTIADKHASIVVGVIDRLRFWHLSRDWPRSGVQPEVVSAAEAAESLALSRSWRHLVFVPPPKTVAKPPRTAGPSTDRPLGRT